MKLALYDKVNEAIAKTNNNDSSTYMYLDNDE